MPALPALLHLTHGYRLLFEACYFVILEVTLSSCGISRDRCLHTGATRFTGLRRRKVSAQRRYTKIVERDDRSLRITAFLPEAGLFAWRHSSMLDNSEPLHTG